MPNLLEVRKRIQSVQNTKKITQAMQLVAASRMKGFQKKALSARSYAEEALQLLSKASPLLESTSYAERRTEGKTLFVLLSSDKGLCGALNAKLFKELLRHPLYQKTARNEQLLITVGKKAAEFARQEGIPIEKSFTGIKEQFDIATALDLIAPIIEYWSTGKAKSIVIVAPVYVNPFVFRTELKTYLPLSAQNTPVELAAEHQQAEQDLLCEPSPERVAEALSLQIVQALMTSAFYELKASEYSSRMVAMKQATESAGEQVRTLTIDYNKARQTAITQQLAELAGAMTAME